MLTTQELSRLTPFSALSEEYLVRVLEHAEELEIEKGKFIFKRGKVSTSRFYLLQGSVDLVGTDWSVEQIAAGSERAALPLTESSPTSVSAVAKEPVRLLRVDADFLDIAMAWSASAEPQVDDSADPVTNYSLARHIIEVEEVNASWMSALLESPLFRRLPPANLQQMLGRFVAVPVTAGELIIKEGLPGDYFYVIESGQAQITGKTGHVDVTLTAGSFFGDEALIGDTVRNASVTMLSDGVLMRLDQSDFTALLQEPLLEHLRIESLHQLEDKNHVELLDIRLPIEHRHCRVPESANVPLGSLRRRIPQLSPVSTYVVTDDGGRRSELAVHLLCQAGLNACLLEDARKFYIGL